MEREELPLGDAPPVGEEQRRDEQEQEKIGIERDVQALLGPGQRRAEHDLDQGQRNGAQVPRSDAGDRPEQEHEQHGFDGMHADAEPV